ncbi:NAD-dependent epimerase/dehydratase family protein [Bifidobacterium pullorum subsp. saeculare]|uniref:NAD-dependent epimerase/dehydratase family protein n=1 Tax=Bifidobacterium pullorum TaxID=78448 RepID=UPI00195D9B30|nr:NAD-dependent epimerase/dehydratase family protein [Bifidobacterium pullorum]MBM6693098.1 NAD-dependent epimerase/dehydratase family protein [Bifidobacterium pullorum subsp. saeculare]
MRILVLGGTGAMGIHVTQLLAEAGHDVIVTSRRVRQSDITGVSYAYGNAKEKSFLDGLLSERWDAIIDFMIWSTSEFRTRVDDFLNASGQYMFTSSYRVYADSPVITEDSPRLLDVIDDSEYLATDEYALAKARCENLLFSNKKKNWTIIRPAVTYDGCGRFQLTVHEADVWLWRALREIPVPVPRVMLTKQATMTWGGDVARMIALLIGNSKAMGETFTVSTAEHIAWQKIADIYRGVIPMLRILDCNIEDFERAHGAIWQIRYDRMYDRIVDNTKILEVTGLKQDCLCTLRDGLTLQLRKYLSRNLDSRPVDFCRQARFDKLVDSTLTFRYAASSGFSNFSKYLIHRFIK